MLNFDKATEEQPRVDLNQINAGFCVQGAAIGAEAAGSVNQAARHPDGQHSLMDKLYTLGQTFAPDSEPHRLIKSAVEQLDHLSRRIRYATGVRDDLVKQLDQKAKCIRELRGSVRLARLALKKAT